MACLDTNVLIDLGNPRRPLFSKAVSLVNNALARGAIVCTTRLNIAELRVGVERAADRAAEERRFRRATSALAILEMDEAAGEQFGRTQAFLLNLGRPTGDIDALIAAICLANGQSLITRNPKHFIDVPGLVVESY